MPQAGLAGINAKLQFILAGSALLRLSTGLSQDVRAELHSSFLLRPSICSIG